MPCPALPACPLCVQAIIRSFRQAAQMAVARVRELAVDIGGKDLAERKGLLEKCAQTSLNSKLVRGRSAGAGRVCSRRGRSCCRCTAPRGAAPSVCRIVLRAGTFPNVLPCLCLGVPSNCV